MTDDPTSNPKPRRTLKQFIAEYLIVITIITASVTVLSFFARQHHIFELMTHFKVLYFLSALLTTIGLLSLRRWYFGMLSLLVLLVHTPGIVMFYIPTESTQTSASPNLTILSANILSYNDDPSQFIDYVLEIDPDILLLQEVSPRWLPHLETLIESDYIYNHLIPQSDNFGMATLSKLPLENIEGLHISPDYPWSIQASLTINKREVTILNFHPLPPGDAYNAVLRDKHLQIARQFALDQKDLCIIAGDFNVTPWSPAYKDLLKDSGLYNTRRGFGLLLTWPQIFPLIPLTHMQRGPNLGSDHRPLLIQLHIPSLHENRISDEASRQDTDSD